MTTYTTPHSLPTYDATDLIADSVDNLRTKINAVSTSSNSALSGVESRANTYADDGDAATLTSAKTYADGGDSTTLTSAKGYADSGDSSTLASAKGYANTEDTNTLNAAKTHADNGDGSTLTNAKAYTDQTVTEANPPGQIDIGTVTTLDSGAQATADIVTTSPGVNELSLGLVRGFPGYNATTAAEDDAAIAAFVREESGDTETGEAVKGPTPTGADDTTKLNDYLLRNAGGTAHLRAGRTYTITDKLSVPTGTTLEMNGATLDATGMPAGTALGQQIAIASEGSIGPGVGITDAITQWSRTVTGITDTAGLTAGDLILLGNDERPVPGMTRTDRSKGELNIIRSVDSVSQVTLTTGALYDYGTTGLIVQKVTPTENVNIRNGTIRLGGVGSAHNGIEVRYGKNIHHRGVIIEGAEDKGISFNTVWGGSTRNCFINGSTSSTTLGNTGYGVAVLQGSRHIEVGRNLFHNCRHFVAGGGYWPAVFVDVVGNHGERSSDAAYDCHESTSFWKFAHNTGVGVAAGFIMRGQHVTVDSNEIIDCTGYAYRARTFDGVTEQHGIRFISNTGNSCGAGLEVDGAAHGAEPDCLKIGPEVRGNTLKNCGLNPLIVRHFRDAVVGDNHVPDAGEDGISCLGLSGTQSSGLTLFSADVSDTVGAGVVLRNVDDITITAGSVSRSGHHGYEVVDCNRTNFAAPTVRTPGGAGIQIVGGGVHNLNGAVVSGGTASTYDAVRLSGTSDVSINGGYLASARRAVYSTTTDYVTVTGVNAHGAFAAPTEKINVDATNKVIANNLL